MDTPVLSLGNGEQTVYFQAGGEWCFLRTPKSYSSPGNPERPTPCVIQCHGHHGYVKDGEADWLTDPEKLSFVNKLLDTGIAVASTHATGNHWGRPNAVASNSALFETLTQKANIDKRRVGLWGGGLGGALVWNTVTGPLLGRLQAVVLQQATISYESVIRNHKFKSNLLEAYGMPSNCPDDLAVNTLSFNDPVNRTILLVKQKGTELAKQLPEVLFIHGDKDENMLYDENPVRLARALEPSGAQTSFHVFEGVGHATYALGDTAAVVLTDFFKQQFGL